MNALEAANLAAHFMKDFEFTAESFVAISKKYRIKGRIKPKPLELDYGHLILYHFNDFFQFIMLYLK